MTVGPVGLEAGKLAGHNRLVVVAVVGHNQAGLVAAAGRIVSAAEGILLAEWPCLWVVVALDCVGVPQDVLVVGHQAVVGRRREEHKCMKEAFQADWDSFVFRLLERQEADRQWGASLWSCSPGKNEGTARCCGWAVVIVYLIVPRSGPDYWKTSF
jgi:hypothetical protein